MTRAIALVLLLLVSGCRTVASSARVVVFDTAQRGFVQDLCVGVTVTADLDAAEYFATVDDARAALRAAEVAGPFVFLVVP